MNPGYHIFSRAPFLKYALAFALGIVLSGKMQVSIWVCAVSILIVLLLYFKTKSLNSSFKLQHLYGFSVISCLLLSGMFYASLQMNKLNSNPLPDYACGYSGLILEKSSAKNKREKYLIRLYAYTDSLGKTVGSDKKIVLYNADSLTNMQARPGNIIHFESKLFPISSANNPGAFDYRKYMYREGIKYQISLKDGFSILDIQKKTLTIRALEIQQNLFLLYQKAGIGGDEFAVLTALTLGNKQFLSNEIKSSFTASGAMHVLAVSGLHVGIIYMILQLLLKPLNGFPKMHLINLLLIVAALWFYAFITGLSPSVLRASTMFSFIATGKYLKRRSNFYNVLSASAFLLMLFDPNIIYNVGFQLSYAAVASIVFFQPKILSLLKTKNPIIKWLWELTAVSIAAQIGTFPISIYYFQQFPMYFWLSNFVVIPAAAVMLYLASFFFICTPLKLLTTLIAFSINVVVRGLNYSVAFIESLPFSVITGISSNIISTSILLLLVLVFGWLLSSKRITPLYILLVIILIFTSYSSYLHIKTRQQNLIIFYDSYRLPLLSLIEGKKHYYYFQGDTLPDNARYLLQGTSTYYKTNEAQSLTSTLSSGNIQKKDHIIFFKSLTIKIKQPYKSILLGENEIGWDPRFNQIELQQIPNLQFQTFRLGKTESFYFTPHNNTFKTLNHSALIIKYSEKK